MTPSQINVFPVECLSLLCYFWMHNILISKASIFKKMLLQLDLVTPAGADMLSWYAFRSIYHHLCDCRINCNVRKLETPLWITKNIICTSIKLLSSLIYSDSDKIRKNTLVFVANAKIESMQYCSPSWNCKIQEMQTLSFQQQH